ncbi:RNA 2'-phosphotransferase [Pedobacter polaris]|uniref:Probable RNA 2'-phosphotransferase n=1 Tax=Pedobacter polaris TaxID=2571273 RepID=A0A4U1CM18_9SPHI|nr:RNA 2'-phosphotransferase [Pedobacter polaris]TKC08306.1 RNA 2'-phosphotransferase [Pedobacter polaris]
MLSEKESKRISKFLSYVLRHHPELIGIELDENGWTDITILIEKAIAHDIKLDQETLNYIVETNNKKRFAFNETFDKIRASQGHSVSIDLAYTPQKPPKLLYHGTAVKTAAFIFKSGIEKQSRQHVHLSVDFETAINVGSRHGKPFVFTVNAEEMFNDQFNFYLAENGVWLTDYVPAKYLANEIMES